MKPFHAERGSRLATGVILEPHDEQVMIVDAVRTYYDNCGGSGCRETDERLEELDMLEVRGGFNGPIIISATEAQAAAEELQRQAGAERAHEAHYLRVIIKGLSRAQNDSTLYYLKHRERLA